MLAPHQPEPSHRPLIAVAAATVATAAAAGWLLQRAWKPRGDTSHRAAQALGAGAAILCVSVTLDSALEHYRGQFKDRAMFVGPTMALLGIGAATWIAFRPERANERLPKIALLTVGATGLIGLGFHAYNILKRPGQLDALNLFYAAPAGAPAALTLAGLYGVIAGEMLSEREYVRTRLPKHTAALIAFSLMGTVAEAGLLHFRGAFQDPAMYAPVTIPPLAAMAIGAAALTPPAVRVADPLLRATAVLGIAGPMFHAYGIHRNMGGWRNWSQMILQGPPLPAPPAFLGIAAAGLGVLPLLGERQK
ncbi:MAG TPA: hypothetical protein VFK28_06315 [Sphingomicrobium sp.]|nr:hypothetical protein [Sphingomicrobium sp.]